MMCSATAFALLLLLMGRGSVAERNERDSAVSKETADAKMGMVLNLMETMSEQIVDLRKEVNSQHQLLERLVAEQGSRQHEAPGGQPAHNKSAFQERRAAQLEVKQHTLGRDAAGRDAGGLGNYPVDLISQGKLNINPDSAFTSMYCQNEENGQACLAECIPADVASRNSQLADMQCSGVARSEGGVIDNPCLTAGLQTWDYENGDATGEERCFEDSTCCFVHANANAQFLSLCVTQSHGTCRTFQRSASANQATYVALPPFICDRRPATEQCR